MSKPILFFLTLINLNSLTVCQPCLTRSYQPVVDYIDRQFESYLQEELKIKRSLHNYHDSRLHACLYFISPSGHSLKSLDLVTMKKLDSKVTCGVSANSDTFGQKENILR